MVALVASLRIKRLLYCCLLFVAQSVIVSWVLAAADLNDTATLFCPCVDRSSLRFSLLTRFHALTSTSGAQLYASARQAARDRGVQVAAYVYNPGIGFNVRDAAAFLEDEIRAGTAGIVASLDSGQFYASFSAANAAGIPIYLVGGGDPALIQALQKYESSMGGPLRASIRYIGPNETALASRLAATLMDQGVNHVECIVSDLEDTRWPSRCRLVQRAFVEAGMSGDFYPLLSNVTRLDVALQAILAHHAGQRIAFLLEDVTMYQRVKRASLPPSANVTVVIYETSVEILDDIHAGKWVLAVDLGVYTQGYLAMALASVEHHTGQMVASDVEVEFIIYGQGAQPVTNQTMQREVCRAAGNPVCGDPGVLPVTPTGCACFDRSEVRYKVIGSIPKRLSTSYLLYQGVVDAQRDLPGSSFPWKIFDNVEIFNQLAEYAEVANSSSYRGAISLDAYASDTSNVILAAIQSVSSAGKPLYLGYLQTPAPNIQAFLDKFGGRVFVGLNVEFSARYIAELARQLQGRHVLIHNNVGYLTEMWRWVKTLVDAWLGGDYPFPPNIWEYPPTVHGSPANRTGAWALFTNPASNQTVQVMEGKDVFLGAAFVQPLHERLAEEFPGPLPTDILVMLAVSTFFSTVTLPMLKNLASVEQPDRPPVRLITHKCSDVEFSALLRRNLTANEELVLGCVDEQIYLSTYLLATAAALEQQTGERVVGEVRTERLLRYDMLPRNYARRVACERANHENGFLKGVLGVFYPLCDARYGCVADGTSAPWNTTACSGHGTCQFYTGVVAGATAATHGVCLCQRGWTGPFCASPSWAAGGDGGKRWRILLAVLLSLGFILLVGLLLVARLARRAIAAARNEGADAVDAILRKDDEAPVTVVVMDVEGLADLLVWDAVVTKKALEVFRTAVRSLLPQYYGQEVTSEDGGFTLAFHETAAALNLAMDLQQGLLCPHSLLYETPTNPLAALMQRRSLGDSSSDWPLALLKHEHGSEVRCARSKRMLYRGLRVRTGIHVGVPERHQVSMSGWHWDAGEYGELATAIRDMASGGQVLMSMQAWRSLGVHVTSIVCHHMGMHQVAEGLPPIHLMQVLPEELAKRAPFAPLKSVRQLGASFFDAPAAECYVAGEPPRDPVVIAFMYVASAKILRKTPGYQGGVDLLVAFVQKRLVEFEAYEVEEKDGNFLLAFRSAAKAVQFAEAIQRESMGLPWSSKLLDEEEATEVIKPAMPGEETGIARETVVFRGLRLQIGMCMDVPSDCQPHMATGRAAYFGTVVNRAARIAATAAPGQTLVNEACYASAKGNCGPVLFKELGKFELKGVKEPMQLFQVFSHELSVRLFPRTLKLAKVTEPIVAFEATYPADCDFEDPTQADADGLRLPQLVSSSPKADMARDSLPSWAVTAGQDTQSSTGTGRAARPSENLARRENRMLFSLGIGAQVQEERTSVELVVPALPANQGQRWQSLDVSVRPQGRSSDELMRANLDGVRYDDMSYNELLKLAIRQHKDIKALKTRLVHGARESA